MPRFFAPEESIAKLDLILNEWVADYLRRAEQDGDQVATLTLGVEFSTRLPEALAGLLAIAIRRIAREETTTDGTT